MGVFRNFPYSNFHEMNMDEIIKIIKNMLEEWATYHAQWDQWKTELEDDWSNYQDVMNEAWADMQDFINNYFDNLDVQEEINNKIVSMIQSGEFGLLVNEYIPPAVNAWLNLNITEPEGVVIDTSLSVAGACADAKATGDAIESVSDKLDIVYNAAVFQIEIETLLEIVPFNVKAGETVTVKSADGNPMTVNLIKFRRANNTEDYYTLTDYTSRTFTVTENFVAVYLQGGTAENIIISRDGSYIASKTDLLVFDDRIDDVNNNIAVIETMVGINKPTYTSTSGSYISYTGNIVQSSAFSYSEPIEVKAGDRIEFVGTGYNTEVAMISLCDAQGDNIEPKIISTDASEHTYEYTIIEDGYIIVSYETSKNHALTIYSSGNYYDEDICKKEIVTPSSLNSGFIHRDGRIMSGDNFRYTNPIRLENETIEFTARGYSDVVSLLSTCDVDGKNIQNIVNSTADEEIKTVKYVSNGVNYVIISSNVAIPITYKKIKILTPFTGSFTNLSMFQKFGVIGDSFASGTLFFNNTSKDDYNHSWGQIMARDLGTTCTNYSKGGLSTRSWLTDSKGLPLVLSSDPEEIYYLALGINDSYSLGDEYLGSLNDITSHSSYEDYDDTFYGNYGKIIEQIIEHAPHAKLVMFTLAHNFNNTSISYSNAIIQIANYYGIPYINQRDDEFFNSSFFWDNMVEGHPIAISYSGMASAFKRLLTDCLKNNVYYFKDTFCYL